MASLVKEGYGTEWDGESGEGRVWNGMGWDGESGEGRVRNVMGWRVW